VLGLDPRVHRHELRQRIGSQLQESALPDRIKVWEALRLFASLAPGAVDWAALLERWGLAAKRNASFASLSGGQRQRLFVALALVNQPEVVFLDEMTTGLDPAARRETWGLIEAIRDQGTTVVLVTHFMDEAERLCDRLAVIQAGRLVALDTPGRLVTAHAGGTRISFSVDAGDLSWLEQVPHVRQVRRRGALVEVEGAGPVVAHLGHALVTHGIEPADLRVHQPTLEDVYLRLTGPDSQEGGSGADAGRDDLG
jgi:ABC-2 type transport system ATP-binding protein